MKWVYPEFLFALLVLIIPILIHLFHFRRYKTIYFSSIAFVKSVEQQQKNPRKIKHLLILIARSLAFACLVIAFAQPYFPHGNTGKKDIRLIGVYIDNSFSMSRIGAQGELLAQARELAGSIVDKAPRNTQYVLFTNELSGNEKQTLTGVKFTDQVSKVAYSPIYRTREEVLSFWNQWVEDAQKEGAALLEPAIDSVTYKDGTTEEVYGFDISVPAIGEDFAVALIGTKGTWYDHTVSVSNPIPVE